MSLTVEQLKKLPDFTPLMMWRRDEPDGLRTTRNVVFCGPSSIGWAYVLVAESKDEFEAGRYWAVSPEALDLEPRERRVEVLVPDTEHVLFTGVLLPGSPWVGHHRVHPYGEYIDLPPMFKVREVKPVKPADGLPLTACGHSLVTCHTNRCFRPDPPEEPERHERQYRMGGELVPESGMKKWHNDRGLPWGATYDGPDPFVVRKMVKPSNLSVHLANEHAVNDRNAAHGAEVEHMHAHMMGKFRHGQEHYHGEVTS